MERFEGIPKEGFAFLLDLRFHNERPWFQENKQTYLDCVKKPSFALAAALGETARLVDSDMETRPDRVVSRIYRDARRVRGGAFYRDVVWLSFKRSMGEEKNPFSFYVYFNPDEYGWGCGFWDPRPAVMEDLRRKIDARPDAFRDIVTAPWMKNYELTGEDYKRPKRESGDAVLDRWYNKKNLSVDWHSPVNADAFSPDLAQRVSQAMLDMAPLYHFVLGMDER
ncbi:MAG: DUF2461 domain-containing protein [Eubacteriales bacterium]|nr:DUF2461 domain-containing protein [Eubacteriales bacterium]